MNTKTIELLPYKGFTATINYSDQDGVYYGKLNTDDLVFFESEYATLMKTEFHKAVDDYLLEELLNDEIKDNMLDGSLGEDYDPRDDFNIGDLQ